jgi:hypothetical protein
MGFDLMMHIDLEIDGKTGMPFVYYLNNGFLDKKPYDPNEFKIPEQFHKYIEQRGSQFHAYVMRFPPDCQHATAKDFLDVYPDWEYVATQIDTYYIDDCWNEQIHNEFKEFLEWMVSKSPYICLFEFYWSY